MAKVQKTSNVLNPAEAALLARSEKAERAARPIMDPVEALDILRNGYDADAMRSIRATVGADIRERTDNGSINNSVVRQTYSDTLLNGIVGVHGPAKAQRLVAAQLRADQLARDLAIAGVQFVKAPSKREQALAIVAEKLRQWRAQQNS